MTLAGTNPFSWEPGHLYSMSQRSTDCRLRVQAGPDRGRERAYGLLVHRRRDQLNPRLTSACIVSALSRQQAAS